MIIKVTNISI